MKSDITPRNKVPIQSPLRTKEEAAQFLRCSARQIEVLTDGWKRCQSELRVDGGIPSSPAKGLRPTIVSKKLIYWDDRDLREYLMNARREQEGRDAVKMEEGS